jgi:hypothetical protein
MEVGKTGGGSCTSSPGEVLRLFVLTEVTAAYDSSKNPMTTTMERKGKYEL